jgi:hypothetical protein
MALRFTLGFPLGVEVALRGALEEVKHGERAESLWIMGMCCGL